MTIDDVESEIWTEVFNDLSKVKESVRNADISLEEVDSLFEDLKDANQIHDELRKICISFGEENPEWIEQRTKQIMNYRSVQRQSEVAKHMMTMQKSFELEGDFQPLRTLSEMVNIAL